MRLIIVRNVTREEIRQMYVCVCHAFTDRDLRATSAATVGEAYRNLGVRPSCGKCVPFVQDMLRTAKRTARSGSSRE